jgi:hypothetical protein
VKESQRIRRNQLLDDPKKVREEVLDRTLWRTRCGRGYGPLLDRQQKMNVCVFLYIFNVHVLILEVVLRC